MYVNSTVPSSNVAMVDSTVRVTSNQPFPASVTLAESRRPSRSVSEPHWPFCGSSMLTGLAVGTDPSAGAPARDATNSSMSSSAASLRSSAPPLPDQQGRQEFPQTVADPQRNNNLSHIDRGESFAEPIGELPIIGTVLSST